MTLRPIDHFGLVVDGFDTPRTAVEPGNFGVSEETTVPPQAGDMPRGDALALYLGRFDYRKATAGLYAAPLKVWA